MDEQRLQLRVGVIGIGILGSHLVRRLASAGHDVRAYDVRRDAVEGVASVATVARSAADAADGCDVVIVSVLDDAQVRDVVAGAESALDAPVRPRVIAIMSTVRPDTIREVAGAAAARGAAVADCAITGVAGIPEGQAAVMVGGTDETFAATRPVFEAIAWKVIHMGPLGSGMNAKLAVAVITFGRWFVASEAARLAAAAGIDVEKLLDAMIGGARFTFDVNEFLDGLAAASGREGHSAFPPEIWRRLPAYARKDLGAALELAAEANVVLPATSLVNEQFESAVDVEHLR